MSDPETEKCPQIATKETKVSSRHYFSPDANSYMNILPSSHVYKELSCLENTGVFTRQRHGGTRYCVSLKQGLVTVRSNPSAAHCQIPSVSHQPITKSIRSLSPSHCVLTRVQGAVTSFMSYLYSLVEPESNLRKDWGCLVAQVIHQLPTWKRKLHAGRHNTPSPHLLRKKISKATRI